MTANYGEILKQSGLKVTPQRIAVMDALEHIPGHPTAEEIRQYVNQIHPSISLTTIYNTLETFVEHGLVKKMKTEQDFVRYDKIVAPHHHLYCKTCDYMQDYFDSNLDQLLLNYFKENPIEGWNIEEITVQISVKHKDNLDY